MKSKLLFSLLLIVMMIPFKMSAQTSCIAPAGLTSSNVSTAGASLGWTAPAGAVYFKVQYRPVTSPVSNWLLVYGQTTGVNLTGLICGTPYEWQVQSLCGTASGTSNTSDWSSTATFTTAVCPEPCLAPTGLTTTNITATGATISWTASTGALAYIIQYRPVTPNPSAWITVTNLTNSRTFTNLLCGTQYEWHVAKYCGTNSTNISAYSANITFTTLACPPVCPAPVGLTATAIAQNSAVLSWLAQGGQSAFIVQYRPVTATASAWVTVTTTTNSLTIVNLLCNTQYEWHVQAICSNTGASNTSVYSATVTFTTLPCTVPCLPPATLTTTNITTTGATISWTGASGALAYLIQYRQVTSPSSAWVNVTSQTNSYTFTNLICGTQYEWHIATYCSNSLTNVSPYSASITFTTSACPPPACLPPTSLATTNITATGAIISWTGSTGAVAYVIQYRPVTPNPSAWVNITTQISSYTFTNLICGTQYEWHVQTYCSTTVSGVSIYSASVIFTTLACAPPPCLPPSGLTTTNIGTTGATLNWTAVPGAMAYIIQYRPVVPAGSAWVTLTSLLNSRTLTNLICGKQYEWHVSTYCGTNSSNISLYSASATFTTLACPAICNAPGSLTTSGITQTVAVISWQVMGVVVGYNVQYRPLVPANAAWVTVNTAVSTLTLSGLSCNTQYEWRVQSICSGNTGGINNTSAYSVSLTFTTLPCTTPTCLPPTGLTSTNSGATIGWSASAGALAYIIQYRPVTVGGTNAWVNATTQATSYTFTTLPCGTQYEWHVAAYCSTASGNTSIYSASMTFSTPPCIPLPGDRKVETGLSSYDITNTQFMLMPYPNPAANQLYLPMINSYEMNVDIMITNSIGSLVYTADKTLAAGGETIAIDINSLAEGVYFIRVKGVGAEEVHRFVVLHQ